MAGLSWHAKTSKMVRFEDEAVRIWYGQDTANLWRGWLQFLDGVGAVSGASKLLGLNLIQALGMRMIAAQTRVKTCAHE